MKQAATAPAPVTCDWHIHSCHSCDCKTGAYPSTMADLVAEIEACGVLDYGITDHIHTPFNLPDLEASRKAFDALPPNPRRHFAVEVNNNAMLTSNSYPEKFKQQYCEFLAAVKGAGVPLSFGSDHHSQHQIYTESACRGGSKSFISSAARLAAVGITDADFWRLPPRKV